MKNITLLLFVVSFTTQAQTNNGVKVFITDEFIDSSTLEKKYEVTREADTFTTIPKRSDRNELFADADLPSHWDELDKDIFYMDLHNKTLSELAKKYPDFKSSDLKKLKTKRK